MKAVYFEQHGEIDVLRYGDVPDPAPAAGHGRGAGAGLRAQLPGHLGAARLARAEARDAALVRRGRGGGDRGGRPRRDRLERRVSGWSSTPGSRPSRTSSRAAARPRSAPATGSWASTCAAGRPSGWPSRPATSSPMPEGMGFAEAAAPLLVALTAWRMLIHRAGAAPRGVRPGRRRGRGGEQHGHPGGEAGRRPRAGRRGRRGQGREGPRARGRHRHRPVAGRTGCARCCASPANAASTWSWTTSAAPRSPAACRPWRAAAASSSSATPAGPRRRSTSAISSASRSA